MVRPAASSPPIVVTGAAGFIGSHVVEAFLEEGRSVIGVDNFRTGKRENLAAASGRPGFTLVEADVAATGTLSSIAAEYAPAAIVHLAALVSVQESMAAPDLNFLLNVVATHRTAEAARLHGVTRLVFASSAAVYGEGSDTPLREQDLKTPPISPYGAAKLASESLLLGHGAAYGITVRCQRFFNVYGPRQDPASPYSGVISLFAREYAAGRAPTIYGDGGQTRDFVSVHDVARATVLSATRTGLPSGTVNICTGRPTSILRLADIFSAGRPGMPGPHRAPARAGDIRHSVGDPSRAAFELGFTAEWTVERGLAELIQAP